MATRKEIEEANADAAYWEQFAKNGWKLYGWSYRHSATFHRNAKQFVEVSQDTLACLGLIESSEDK